MITLRVAARETPPTMDWQSAEQWNATHPTGTRVSVTLRSGETFSAEIATQAQQWGDLALVTLVGVDGHWTLTALSIQS